MANSWNYWPKPFIAFIGMNFGNQVPLFLDIYPPVLSIAIYKIYKCFILSISYRFAVTTLYIIFFINDEIITSCSVMQQSLLHS